jgi:hypothetical protein
LYHLKDDIGEQHNVIDENPEVANRLYTELQAWLRETDAKMPSPNPNAK